MPKESTAPSIVDCGSFVEGKYGYSETAYA
jgi:hypothetical protein